MVHRVPGGGAGGVTGGELMGDHEDLEAHEIEQSKPMTAKELARAEKDDDDSVKSKASKFVRPSA